LHVDLGLPWMQMLLPPHSLQYDFRLPWMQMLLPPHSLHCDLRLPWMQMLLPPHSLHFDFRRPWMQTDAPSQFLARGLFLCCMHTDAFSCISAFWWLVRPTLWRRDKHDESRPPPSTSSAWSAFSLRRANLNLNEACPARPLAARAWGPVAVALAFQAAAPAASPRTLASSGFVFRRAGISAYRAGPVCPLPRRPGRQSRGRNPFPKPDENDALSAK
jgi:hypothetical protein